MKVWAPICVSLFATQLAFAAPAGQVSVPLADYQRLLAGHGSDSMPVRYSIGRPTVTAVIAGDIATVEVDVPFEVYGDTWTLVPLLPAGTMLVSANVDGTAVSLDARAGAMSWVTNKAGVHQARLNYTARAHRAKDGWVVGLGLPLGPSSSLVVTLPDEHVSATVVPASSVTRRATKGATVLQAELPSATAAQVSWRVPEIGGHAISRAKYVGRLDGGAVRFEATYEAELFEAGPVRVPLFDSSVTLADVRVDGRPATVVVEAGRFATHVRGRGRHVITVGFVANIESSSGKPKLSVSIPPVPISHVNLSLPGNKSVHVSPASAVAISHRGGNTKASFDVAMSERLEMTWTEASPPKAQEELRANASLVHVLRAEEGVLHGLVTVDFEVTRGETNALAFDCAREVHINKITAAGAVVNDWRVDSNKASKRVTVFLDRKVRGTQRIEVALERLLEPGEAGTTLSPAPVLTIAGVHRQRGLIALVESDERTLRPVEERDLTRVGDNQLPAFVKAKIEAKVAHTFKYVDGAPHLIVAAVAPDSRNGKIHARVDTLTSLSDVALRASASVAVDVKSGSITGCRIELPLGVSVLAVSAPSLRTHKVIAEADRQLVDVSFTQKMQGQFRLDVSYEQIVADGARELTVPMLKVVGAEVEQGRVAVEALTAVEVSAEASDQLNSIEPNELPQQLVMKTTNPILLAYKYVRSDEPPQLKLRVTRHAELDVQVATIDEANYKTLLTRDGLAVTTARFVVRNSKKQFLKVVLPKNSKVWSAFVDGRPERPALAEGGAPEDVLIKIVTSATGFEVELVYATPMDPIRALGTVVSELPRPDMIVTRTRWDLFVPEGPAYRSPKSNMTLVAAGVRASPEAMADPVARPAAAAGPLEVKVPVAGLRYGFEKLYANQGDEAARISIAYTSPSAHAVTEVIGIVGGLLFVIGILAALRGDPRVPRRAAALVVGAGVAMITIAVGYFDVAASGPIVTVFFAGLLASVAFAVSRVMLRRHAGTAVRT